MEVTRYSGPSPKQATKNAVVKEIMKDEAMRKRGRDATDAAKQCTTLIHRLPPHVVEPLSKAPLNEREVFESAKAFLEQEFGVRFTSLMPKQRSREGEHRPAVQAGRSSSNNFLFSYPFFPVLPCTFGMIRCLRLRVSGLWG